MEAADVDVGVVRSVRDLSCSAKESVDPAGLPRLLEAAAKRWAASWTLEGRVPALALRKPGG